MSLQTHQNYCLDDISFDMSEETCQKIYLENILFDMSEETHQKNLLRRRDTSKIFGKTNFGMSKSQNRHTKIKSFFSLELALDTSKFFT